MDNVLADVPCSAVYDATASQIWIFVARYTCIVFMLQPFFATEISSKSASMSSPPRKS